MDIRLQLWRAVGDSPAYEKLAKYIEKNYVKIIFMTAEEAAACVGVSQGTVSRFCIAMGYKGFNDYVRTLQDIVSEQLTAPRRLELTSDKDSQANTDLMLKEARNIMELKQVLATPEYKAMLDMVVHASNLILLSARLSATLLPYMEYLLNKIRGNVFFAVPGSREWEQLYWREAADTGIITIGFPRYSTELLQKLEEAKQAQIPVCAMTDSRFSPLVELADHTVFIPLTVSSIFDMYSTPMAFINLLLRDAAVRIPNLEERMERIEKRDRAQKVYYRGGM